MKIGITTVQTIGQGENKTTYLQMSVRPPFMESATFTITKNTNEQKAENEPDYYINYSFNRKNEKFPRVRAGAIWDKVSDNGQTEYKSGVIESPIFQNGKIHIAIFEAKPIDENTPLTHRHDVVWSPPQLNQNNEQQKHSQAQTQGTTNMPSTNSIPTIDIDEDEIPF
ncbi:MAG: DUF736 family protein [Helicobacteraceae bacterium]|nr:DUF736 family protein [Helicobacteraceae bacterium]